MIKSMFLGQKANAAERLGQPSVLKGYCCSTRFVTGPEWSGAHWFGKGCGVVGTALVSPWY